MHGTVIPVNRDRGKPPSKVRVKYRPLTQLRLTQPNTVTEYAFWLWKVASRHLEKSH